MTTNPRALVDRLLGLADEATDDEDLRLRKRVGVLAGYILVLLPLQLPFLAQGVAIGWIVAITMPLVSATNLVVLARTRRFERYVVVLVILVLVAPVFVEIALGGLAGSSAAIVFAFLGPVLALLALGPARATAWFVGYLLVLGGVIVLDPIFSSSITPQPYPLRLIWYFANLAVPMGLTFAMLRYTDIRRRLAEQRSEELLTNAIPTAIAARLKRGEQRIAERYPEATVVFADLAGFTPWSAKTDAADVVAFLDSLFSRFDELATGAGVEKIKTIGDSYMAVAGVPQARSDHADAGLALATAFLAAVREAPNTSGAPVDLRVGIASGEVVAGVIGRRRILFDLWGNTVNVAARMESTGVPGRIHVAQSTRDLAGSNWSFEEREPIDVKGMGAMKTYLVVTAAA
jgi:class 3 adenylate cyclase